jgi:hypothetical protein
MPEKILLKCLLKNSITYHIVKELKSNDGELDFNELKNNLKMTHQRLTLGITRLYPAVIQNDSKVSVSKNYDFLVLGRMTDISSYHSHYRKYL